MDLARDIISRGRCSVPTCPCEAFVRLDLPSVPNTPCICTHNGYQHVRGGGEEALLSVQCGGFLAATGNDNGDCVCGWPRISHGPGGLPSTLPQLPALRDVPTISTLAPSPGPSRPVASSNPITHTFSPSRHLSGTSGERRAVSAERAAARNRGGVPSPALNSSHRGRSSRPLTSSQPRSQPPSLLTLKVLFFPIYMRKLLIPYSSDLPVDFLEQFWITPEEFGPFLKRLDAHDLFFSVQVPCDDHENDALVNAISARVETIGSCGGPKLPKPDSNSDRGDGRCWEFLSCKRVKVFERKLRRESNQGSGNRKKVEVIEIKPSADSVLLPPVEYKVRSVTKAFGIKNPLWADASQPSDFVVIGPRFQGHCSAKLTRVHRGDLEGETDVEHGCYPYRLLHGLNICGEDTSKTFARLLERCRQGNNHQMCPTVIDDAEMDVPDIAPQNEPVETNIDIPDITPPNEPDEMEMEYARVNVNLLATILTPGLPTADRPRTGVTSHPQVEPLEAQPTRSSAIQASKDYWTTRTEGTSKMDAYVQWHALVRPSRDWHQLGYHDEHLNLQANSIDDLSQALIYTLDSFHRYRLRLDPNPQAPHGVQYQRIKSLGVFFQPTRQYKVQFLWGNGYSSGFGPERATFQRAIRTLTEDRSLWVSSGGSDRARPAFTPVITPAQQIRWRSTGSLILLHLLATGNGPEPISPFLVYLLLAAASLRVKQDRSLCAKDVLIGLGSLYRLDDGTADMLRPWMVLKESDRVSRSAGELTPPEISSIQQLLNHFEFELNQVATGRSKEEHEGWTSSLISWAFMGCDEPWNKRQFELMYEGFTAPMGGETGECTIADLLETTTLSQLELVVTSYDRKVKEVGNVTQLFKFNTNDSSHDTLTNEQLDAIPGAFKNALFSYMSGVGHVPGTSRGQVELEEFNQRRGDRLFRAQAVLRQLTDSWLLPVGDGPETEITVTLKVVPHFADDTSEPSLRIATCSRSVEIQYTKRLHAMILEHARGNGRRFEQWIHPQMILMVDGSDYNML